MQLTQAFRIRSKQVIAFVGGGGKTTALFRLADELAAQGKRVITTTTTRIFAAQIERAPRHLFYDATPDFITRVLAVLEAHPHLLIVGAETEDGKALGVPPALVDELSARAQVDAILVEADGARMRPFKAPAEHEPVIPDSTTLLVPVIGAPALGASLDDDHVHRAEIIARLAGARIGEPITPNIAARVIAHAEGGLKDKPRHARCIVLVNQVETDEQLESARLLVRLLLGYAGIDAVAIGAAHARRADPIRETHRRVAAIVLAAGAGTRMAGRVKQLLPWRGKTLLENAIDVAMQSSAHQVYVVLGAHAGEIRLAIRNTSAQVIVNREWETGQASGIRAGVRVIPPHIDAAIFINADQPLITSAAIDRVIARYYVTDAPMVVSQFAGRRGSPVLFDRAHFAELMQLEGEQGGRELFARHADELAYVDFEDARLGLDVDTPEEYENVMREM